MLIKNIITENIHEDKTWAQAHMPGGSADSHSGEFNKLLEELSVDGKKPPVELVTMGDLIGRKAGAFRGIYLLFGRTLKQPHEDSVYLYIGLAGDKSTTAGFIADRWSQQHFKAYSLRLEHFVSAAQKANSTVNRDGIIYFNSKNGKPDYGKPFDKFVKTEAEYFLTPKSFNELQKLVDAYDDGRAWEPNKDAQGNWLDPNGNITDQKWIKSRPFITQFKPEMDPERNYTDYPVAIINLEYHHPEAVKYAEKRCIQIYNPVGNKDRQQPTPFKDVLTDPEHRSRIDAKKAGARASVNKPNAVVTQQPTKRIDATIQQSLMTPGTALNTALIAIDPAERSEARDEAIEYMNDGRTAQEVLARLQSWV